MKGRNITVLFAKQKKRTNVKIRAIPAIYLILIKLKADSDAASVLIYWPVKIFI